MDFKQLFDDDRAVSPVIGVILMVAITVILAAVIGTFVLGLGEQVQSTSPQASFGFDYTNNSAQTTGGSNDSLVVTHETGDSISGSQLNIAVSGAQDGEGNAATYAGDAFTSSEVSAGTQIDVSGLAFTEVSATDSVAENLNLASATVRVTWTSETGDTSSTLGKWSGPEA